MANPYRIQVIADRARRFAALGDPTRLQVFELVTRGPISVGDLAARLPVSRPAVSQHLKVLTDAGLVRHDAVGTRHVYVPQTDGVASLREFLDSLWNVGLARFKSEAEAMARRRKPSASKEPT
jgi:DNA-binding transcriptional ArsR family regulator